MPRALVLFSAARPPADNEVRTLVLPHPRGGEPALFARSGDALVELQRSKSDHGAWFVDDAAHAGAGVVVATPYDARLSLLSVLTTSATRRQFVPLEQVVAAAGHEGLRCLLDLDLGPLGAFCDEKDLGDGLRLVRLAEAPTVVDWLHGKVRRVAAVVDAAAAAETVGASDAFVAASAGAPATAAVGPSRRATLRAVQAVCEYVADEWAAQVAERSGVALAEVFPGLASRPSGAENVWAHEAEEQKLHELAFGTAAKRQKVEAGGAAAKQTSTKRPMAKALGRSPSLSSAGRKNGAARTGKRTINWKSESTPIAPEEARSTSRAWRFSRAPALQGRHSARHGPSQCNTRDSGGDPRTTTPD